jgi:hypothetical protein
MKMEKVTPRNNTNKIKKRMYNCCINLIWIPVSNIATKNTIENIATIKLMLSKNSMNFVSISYCDGMKIMEIL